jgi:hypothetical protein
MLRNRFTQGGNKRAVASAKSKKDCRGNNRLAETGKGCFVIASLRVTEKEQARHLINPGKNLFQSKLRVCRENKLSTAYRIETAPFMVISV